MLTETVDDLMDEVAEAQSETAEHNLSYNEEEEIGLSTSVKITKVLVTKMFIFLEESFEEEPEAEEEEDEDDYDVNLMARALQASEKRSKPAKYQLDAEGTIALDSDEDDEPTQETRSQGNRSEDSSEYSINNDVIDDSDDYDEAKDELEALRKKQLVKPFVMVARKLVKKSFRFLALRKLEGKRSTERQKTEEKETRVDEKLGESSLSATLLSSYEASSCKDDGNVVLEISKNGKEQNDEMETSEKEPEAAAVIEHEKQVEGSKDEKRLEQQTEKELNSPPNPITESEEAEKAEKILEKPFDNSSDSSRHESSLLTEIANASTEEIFNRYVAKTADQSPTLDEFSEELFYCLQLNNIEIEKAKQLWNEKLHIKYKIRELMETIRRHRAVMEIEAFGYKPGNSGSNSRPVVSSKSSTTNSDTDNYEKHSRMSAESVSRLIQDVRASMLKRDDKLRNAELASESNAGEGSLAAQWNSLQSNTGRQGQIVDVQSIINDFRQKNPQEIPRRGRRMKSAFDNHCFERQPEESRNLRKDFISNVTSNSNDINNPMKTSSGYPEVSLHPVQNLYKNLSNASGASSLGIQRSSLLQSILTKVLL